MKIKKFNEMLNDSKQTFNNTKPTDLAWMSRDEVISMVCNTFNSKIIDNDIRWTVIESDWELINKNSTIGRLEYDPSIANGKHKVYFIITMPENTHDQFMVIRGKSNQEIIDFLNYAESKNSEISGNKGSNNYVNGNHFSAILRREGICRVQFCLKPVPKFENHVDEGDDTYFTYGLASSSISISDKNFAYYSDLLVGTELDMKI